MAGHNGKTYYTEELADEILLKLACGDSLNKTCLSDDRFPDESSVREWIVKDHNGFAAKYFKARMSQADAHADRIADYADQVMNDQEIDPNRARVAIDALKWTAAKLKPKTYGDRLEASLELKGGFVGVLASLEELSKHRMLERGTIEHEEALD